MNYGETIVSMGEPRVREGEPTHPLAYLCVGEGANGGETIVSMGEPRVRVGEPTHPLAYLCVSDGEAAGRGAMVSMGEEAA